MTKDEALTLAAEMERGQFSTTLLPAAAELRRLHEENRRLKAQQALDRKAENARELGLDYEPEQDPCGGCGGSGWVSRDPDIGTDQECFVCEGAGVIKPEQEPCCYGGIAHDCHAGKGCRIVERMKVTQKPPQRTWVGLTEDERGGILVTYCEAGLWRLAEAIEAKLKEKNK